MVCSGYEMNLFSSRDLLVFIAVVSCSAGQSVLVATAYLCPSSAYAVLYFTYYTTFPTLSSVSDTL